MSKPFKFQYANQIAGAFFLVSITIVVGVSTFSGKLKGWFEKERIFYVGLPSEGTAGIRPGSEVRVMGRTAGFVTKIENGVSLGAGDGPDSTLERFKRVDDPSDVPEERRADRRLLARLSLREDATAFIGVDSTAKLRYDLGGLGASFFEVTRGSIPLPSEPPGDKDEFIAFEAEKAIQSELGEVVAQIAALTDKIEQPIDELTKSLVALQALIGEDGSVRVTFDAVAETLEEVAEKTNDPDQRMISALLPESTVTDINATLAKINESVEAGELADLLLPEASSTDLEKTLANLERATNKLIVSLDKLPATINRSDDAIVEIERAALELRHTVEGIQDIGFIRKKVQNVKTEEAQGPGAPAQPEPERTRRFTPFKKR